MRPSQALRQYRTIILQAADRYHVRNPRVFGSVLQGLDEDGSDLDLLVEPLPVTTLFDLGGFQFDLEETLGVPVDMLTPGDLPTNIRERVLQDAVPL